MHSSAAVFCTNPRFEHQHRRQQQQQQEQQLDSKHNRKHCHPELRRALAWGENQMYNQAFLGPPRLQYEFSIIYSSGDTSLAGEKHTQHELLRQTRNILEKWPIASPM